VTDRPGGTATLGCGLMTFLVTDTGHMIGSALDPRASVFVFSLRRFGIIALFALLFLLTSSPAHATIRYTVSLDHPDQHLFHVSMQVPIESSEVTTALPAWNALYQIRDFAERVRDVTAGCGAGADIPLEAQKTDKQEWKLSSAQVCGPQDHSDIAIHYSIFWDTPGPFDSQLNDHHAFLNLAEVLMYMPNRRDEDVSVQFTNLPDGWQTATALAPASEANTYTASNYDSLVDAPVEAGMLDQFSFESDGVPIHVVLDGKESAKSRLQNYLLPITRYELNLMGGAPFDSPDHGYTFFFHIGSSGEVGGGGMEHRNSSAIAGGSPEECGAIAAHEFFHAWNVKRIRPQSLEPVDYSKEQYTRALWFAEGVTNTYETFALERTGLWSKEQFYKDLAGQIDILQSRPARLWQSAEESSLDAWFEGFPDYGDPARSISYYNKGDILGVLLDLAIRDATDDRKSFDDVMRLMNDEYAKRGTFYDDSDGIRGAVEQVSGKSFKDFFARYVSGTQEIPYNDFLGLAGLALQPGPRDSSVPRYSIVELPQSTDRQRRIRDGFLHGATN
jgi:predicted metalloprotease with PDZ domain